MKNSCLLMIFALLFTGYSLASEMNWILDLDEALTKAREEDKPVLVDFSGSDWCIWCQRLDEQVFAHAEFIQWAKENVVACLLDFPRKERKHTVSAEQAAKNKKNAEQYGVRGYPTVLVIAPDGTIIGRTGYRRGGPKAYIKHLEGLLLFCKACHSRKKRLEKARGLPKARLAASLLKHCPAGAEGGLMPLAKAIFEEDENNETSLRPQAAYILIKHESALAEEAEEYLASTKPTQKPRDKDYFLQLVEERASKRFYALMRRVDKAQEGVGDKEVNEEAAELINLIERVIDRAQKERAAGLFLKLAVAQACAPNVKEAIAALWQAEKRGVSSKRLKSYRDYINGLQK